MYYIACRLDWKFNNKYILDELNSTDMQWKSDWFHEEEPNHEEWLEHDRQFARFHEHLENCTCEGFHLTNGYKRLDEALAAYITMLKGLNPKEMFIDDSLIHEFIFSHFRELDNDDDFRNYFSFTLWEKDFGCIYSIHLFRKEDGVDPLNDRLGRDIDWGETTDIMVASYYPFEEETVPKYHTVICQNLDKLTDAEREDVLLYCGVDAQRGPQEYQIAPGFSQNSLERVPLIEELACDIAEASDYKRPREIVAIENLLRSYMKDYGLSMADDDWYSYDDTYYEGYSNYDPDNTDMKNRFCLELRVIFVPGESVSPEILEKTDADGYYWTSRQRQKYIPYEDGYVMEFISRQQLKSMEEPKGPVWTRYKYRKRTDS